MKIALKSIEHNQNGFNNLTDLIHRTEACTFEDIEIDMHRTSWFDADMCAPFGAALYRISRSWNTVNLVGIPPKVEKILSKNRFLGNYGRTEIYDTYGTTIPYQRFEVKDDRYFSVYVEEELVRRKEIPKMSLGLSKKFRESIFEIFSNAVIHSETKLGIFSCGQFFPNKNQLSFSIADLGIGIPYNVNSKASLNLEAEEAIAWAVEGRNTTKRGSIPGGLGLKILREFIDLNKGEIQIVSDKGYWRLKNGHVYTTRFQHPFPGTIVNIEINTADTRTYLLASEDLTEIF